MRSFPKSLWGTAGQIAAAIAVVVLAAGCGGGGGGGTGGGGALPTATPTLGRNSTVRTNANGTIILTIDELEIAAGDSTAFSVVLKGPTGAPLVNEEVRILSGTGIEVVTPDGGVGQTDANGRLEGELRGTFSGVFSVQAFLTDSAKGFETATLNVRVFGGSQAPTATSSGGPGPTITPTAAPVADVVRIIVQPDKFRVVSADGGTVELTILAFNKDNVGVPGVRMLLDASPSAGVSFSNRTPTTDGDGRATTTMTIEPGTPVATVIISAAAGSVTGSVPISIVSGDVTTTTVERIIVQAAPSSVSSADGGTVQVSIFAFDKDNIGVPNVRMLVDAVPSSGLTVDDRTPTTDSSGMATSTLTVAPGATVGTVIIRASAGDVSGEVPISIVSATSGGQPVTRVEALLVNASPASISSAVGGTVNVTVDAFDESNVGVPGVRLLLDASPRIGLSFSPQTPLTSSSGRATSVLTILPGAAVGALNITATAGMKSGQVPISVVSGVSQRPVAKVVLESDQPTIGTDSGGTASLRARVFDADNVGIPDVNVLFETEIGQVNPAVEISCGGTQNPCPPAETGLAQTTLIVAPNAITREYNLKATAGGITGSTTITIVPGRGGTGTGNPNAAAGEPASISLGASPTRIQVIGVGGTEQATVITRIFDNNNNPVLGKPVALRVIPDRPGGAQMLPLSGQTRPASSRCLDDPDRNQAFNEGKLAIGLSDRAGFVLASVRAGTVSGTVTVEACADSLNSDGVTVTTVTDAQPVVAVASGPPESVSVAVNRTFVDNNDGTLLTTVAALLKDRHGNTVEDGTAAFFEVTNRQDVAIIGSSTTNQVPPCDTSQFTQQTGLPVTAQPGNAITCMTYPSTQSGTIVRLRVESGGVSNEDNSVQDEEFTLPPGGITGPATGIPSARGFSLATEFRNLSGRVTFGLTSTITAFVADRSGNPVSRNTRVRFVSDYGGITSENTTDLLGRTTASLRTQGPLPPDGIVLVTAIVRGEEDFIDVNGNGVFDPGTDIFDPTIHDQDGDGQWSGDTDIQTVIAVDFSGPTRLDISPNFFQLRLGQSTCFDVHVADDLDNPIVGGSTVRTQTSDNLQVLGPDVFTVPDASGTCAQSGACDFVFCVFSSAQVAVDSPASFAVTVESSGLPAGGNGSVVRSVNGLILTTPTP